MNGIKLISRLEYDSIINNSIDFFDTKLQNEYRISQAVTLRCYFAAAISSNAVDMVVIVRDVVRISFNSVSKMSLYRVYFEVV
jgi:hypothetical protein